MAFITANTNVSVNETPRPGFFRRVVSALTEARALEARRQVNGYLLSLDDQTLAELGYNRAALKRNGATMVYFS